MNVIKNTTRKKEKKREGFLSYNQRWNSEDFWTAFSKNVLESILF